MSGSPVKWGLVVSINVRSIKVEPKLMTDEVMTLLEIMLLIFWSFYIVNLWNDLFRNLIIKKKRHSILWHLRNESLQCRHTDPQHLPFHLLLHEWTNELWSPTTQANLSAKKGSLNDWNIWDAPPDKRSKNKGVEWEAGELHLTLWSTWKWEGLIPVYTDLTQQLLSTGVMNMSTRRILLSPGDNAAPRAWPHRWRQTWHDNPAVGERQRGRCKEEQNEP